MFVLGLGAGFPVLKKTQRVANEENAAETSLQVLIICEMAFLCCVEVGKIKFNERFTHQRKWDNESDVSQKHGNFVAFFIRLRSKL